MKNRHEFADQMQWPLVNFVKTVTKLRIFYFFSVRSIFFSPNEQQKQYFYEWRSHSLISLLVFMSEIKTDLSLLLLYCCFTSTVNI